MRPGLQPLHQLARLCGVQTAYYDVTHRRQLASPEALLALLRSLGVPVASFQNVPEALREQRAAQWRKPLEPVMVAWDGILPPVEVRLPRSVEGRLDCHLKLENGEARRWQGRVADLPVLKAEDLDGVQYVVRKLPLPETLPQGYHHLSLEVGGKSEEALVVSAPLKAYSPDEPPDTRLWGLFLPLYALRTRHTWGSGSFADIEPLTSWIAEAGGSVFGTLPLLPLFIGQGEPSPYLPVSRLLWSEFYLDIASVPELEGCPRAKAMLASPSFQDELKALRESPLVDYTRLMALKRRVLEELCHCIFASNSRRLDELYSFLRASPVVEDYARFRAAGDKNGISWRSWPERSRSGVLEPGDYREEDRRYHLYAQWLAREQLKDSIQKARKKGVSIYSDLPVGVHPDGYDVWRERGIFLPDVVAGAPPDVVFTRGQNWEFPPLHPERVREQGYRYVIAYLRQRLIHAGILRIDHVMGLHRLFCIPKGFEASQGLYLRYHPEEIYAIISLESHRHRVVIVGEDLGTVPPEVRPAMRRHGLHRMYVLHYELASSPGKGPPPPARNIVASLNTHDMPPFASLWQGLDIKERLHEGLLNETSARHEEKLYDAIRKALITALRSKGWVVAADILSVLKACLGLLSASRARVVLVNVEDLWLETRPQNTPGTRGANWQRKTRYSFEEFCLTPQVADILRMVNRIRRQGIGHTGSHSNRD